MPKDPLQKITALKQTLTFGKHKGQAVGDVITLDPGYILWLDEKGIVKFPRRILEKASEEDAKRPQSFRVKSRWLHWISEDQ